MKFLTAYEAAELLQVSHDTVVNLVKAGELQAERLTPRGRYRINKQSLVDFAARRKLTLYEPQQDQ